MILGDVAGAFNTSVFVAVVDQHVSRCAVAVLQHMVMDHGRLLGSFPFTDASY